MTVPSETELEVDLDHLFRAPPAEFVAHRNTLVQSLRRAGQREAAAKVAKLPRPSAVAWAINQLRFEAPGLLDALRNAGAALRVAQESSVSVDEFSTRKSAHREALRAATDHAFSLAARGGLNLNADAKRRLEMNLKLLSAASDVEPPPGRMVVELEPLGFDALSLDASVPLAPAPRPSRAEVASEAELFAMLAPVKEAFEAAERESRRLAREAESAESSAARAERNLEDAEQRAEALRRARDEARTLATEVRARADDAAHELEAARKALEELEAPSRVGRTE